MFKIIGALVVYGFAAYGLSVFLEGIEGKGKAGRDNNVFLDGEGAFTL